MMSPGLPVSPTDVMYQRITFTPQNPPFVPQLNGVNQQLFAEYAGYVCAGLANVVSNNLWNAPRIFAFNMMAANNWQNANFAELVNVAFTILDLTMRQNYGRVDINTIDAIIEQSVTLVVSKLTCSYDAFKNICQPQEYNAAMQNLQKLNSYFNVMQTQPGVHGFQQPQQPQHQFGRAAPGIQNAIGGGGGGMNMGSTQTNRDPISQSKFFTKSSAPVKQNMQQAEVAETLTVKDWKSSESQPYRNFFNPLLETATYERLKDGNVIETITPIQENNVDRDKHRLVATLGNNLRIGSTERIIEIGANAVDLSAIRPRELEKANKDQDTEPDVYVSQFIYPKVLVDAYKDAAIFTGRLQQFKHQDNSLGPSVYRCFATVFSPQITVDSYNEILERLEKAKHFADVASILATSASGLQTSLSLDIGSQEEKNKFIDLGIYLSSIDDMMTGLVNSFLKNELSLENVNIDSFTSDVADIPGYLERRFNDRYLQAFLRYEKDIMNSLFSGVKVSSVEDQLYNIVFTEQSENLKFSFVPEQYSFTYLNVLAKELNLDNVEATATMISESRSPILFDVVQSLFRQCEGMPIFPAHNLLITKDQKIFKLHKGYLSSNSYLISK